MSVSIEGINLLCFIASQHLSPSLASDHVSRHAEFHYFLLMTVNLMPEPQMYTVNTLLNCCKNRTVLFYGMINIWVNTDGCTEKYFCATELYLL